MLIPSSTSSDTASVHLLAALDAMGEGVAILDPDDCYLYWNRRYAELHRESRHLVRGLPFHRILEIGLAERAYPEAIGRESEWLEARLARHRRATSIEEQELPDGQWIRIEERKTTEGGSISVAVDITELKRRELELTRTKTFLNTLIESIPNMLVVRDPVDHRVLLINRAGEDLLGISREDILGRTPYELFPADEAESTIRRDREVIESGLLGVFDEEPITTRKNGRRYVQTKKLMTASLDGQASHLLAICEDVTDRKIAAEALARARDAAEAANRAKSEFLSNVTHELRTPLNGVLGLAHVLAYGELQPTQRKLVETIISSASGLDRLLSDVLDLASIEAGRLEIVLKPCLLSDVADRVISQQQENADAKRLNLAAVIRSAPNENLLVDAKRLEQVLGNLVDNAIKFTDQGSVVLTVDVDSHVRFRVSDTGIGLQDANLSRIFARFEQADGSSTRRHGGTGLGLAISRDLAELMGGSLGVSSVLGSGSTFTLEVPLKRSADYPANNAPVVGRLETGD